MDLHGLYGFTWILYGFIWIYVDLYAYLCIYIGFYCFYELGVASKRAAGAFFRRKNAFPDFLTMSILETVRFS